MKKILLTAMAAGLITLGCSKEEDEFPAPSATAPASVSASGDMMAPPPGIASASSGNETAPPPAEAGAPMFPAATEFSDANRPKGDDGQTLNDIQYLNDLLSQFNMRRSNFSPEPYPQFKTADEQKAYDQWLIKFRDPVTDLNELVRYKVLRALPTPPAGKKYVVNAQTMKVELADATATH